MLDFVVVIPARFASTRLPGKPLLDIAGKPMVVHVAERARDSGAAEVWVATDDVRIKEAVERHGYRALLTATHHRSGTDRAAEVASILGWASQRIVVNVQGDEPRIDPTLIQEVAVTLHSHGGADMSTACHRITSAKEAFDPNCVKVVLDRHGEALYFSRATIPWARDAFAAKPGEIPAELPLFRHIGIYAYRSSFLQRYPSLAAPALERYEALEQLRALWHGHRIAVRITEHPPEAGVDTAEDLEIVRRMFAGRPV